MQTKEKMAAYFKVWYANNRQKRLAKIAAYDASHPNEHFARACKARAKRYGAKIGDGKAILAWLNGWKTETPVSCYYCKAVAPGTGMTMDHVIPMSKGGDHDLSNLVVCCPFCNNSKHDQLPAEWQAKTPDKQ